MEYGRIAPGPEAARFVSHYWTMDGDASGAVQRVVPDGSPELILHLGSPFEAFADGAWNEQAPCFIAGQLTGPLLLRSMGPAKTIGVTFRPHGLAQVLGFSPSEIAGTTVVLEDVNLGHLSDLPGRGSIGELEHRLLRHLRTRTDEIAGEAVNRIVACHGGCDIAALARELGLTTRHLERRFFREVGLLPKLFARMRRFQNVFPVIEGGNADWAAAAVTCGYYDQAHLIRDFREFAGEPPARLLASDDLARHFLSHFSNTGKPALR